MKTKTKTAIARTLAILGLVTIAVSSVYSVFLDVNSVAFVLCLVACCAGAVSVMAVNEFMGKYL